ncbi:dicarboxylate/amino acid:cation symporter [Methylovirgula sp. 4M-Z18]|nr:dicarboxylate/amino acid:cation symporter [Methylovirgula sp. 4M-Z18]
MILGIVVGHVIHTQFDHPGDIGHYFGLLATIFLTMIKMIISPLVISTLIAGIAHMGTGGAVGRVGGKSLLWFVCASFVSLSLGWLMVTIFQPGIGEVIERMGADALKSDAAASALDTGIKTMSIDTFVSHVIPTSIVDVLAKNEILPVVFFSVFFGVGLAAIGDKGLPLLHGIEIISQVMLKVTGYVMVMAAPGVFGAMVAIIAKNGIEAVIPLARFMGEFYFTMAALWVLMILVGFLILGPRITKLISLMLTPVSTAFATASSEAAFPKVLEGLERFGVSKRIASFVLPLGYSFNLDGSMLYCTFAALFIAQATHTVPPVSQQFIMLLVFMITSKGIAGVPRASLVVIAASMAGFGIPVAGMAMILGVDAFLDMGRSATNVVGNSLAASVVAKWESELGESLPEGADLDAVPAE